jgi:hypothetical protein
MGDERHGALAILTYLGTRFEYYEPHARGR